MRGIARVDGWGALQAVAERPYGPPLVPVLALGLVAFGVFCFFDARYRKD